MLSCHFFLRKARNQEPLGDLLYRQHDLPGPRFSNYSMLNPNVLQEFPGYSSSGVRTLLHKQSIVTVRGRLVPFRSHMQM